MASDADDTLETAVRLLQDSRFSEARDLLSRYSSAQPQSARGWFLLGACCHGLGDLNAALSALTTACDLSPDFVQALSALAAVQLALGDSQGAIARYRRALEIEPRNAQLWTNIGVVLAASNDWQGALLSYDRALGCDAGLWSALMNRGVALIRLGRLEDALSNNDRFAEMYADLPQAHFNRAEVLLAMSRFDEALAAADRAAVLAPKDAAIHFDRGLALACLGQLAEAAAALDASHALNPDLFASLCRGGELLVQGDSGLDVRVLYLLRLFARREVCDWRREDELVSRFTDLVTEAVSSRHPIEAPELLFSSLSVPIDPGVRLALARSVADGFARRAHGSQTRRLPRASRDRVRVGYMSPDLRQHAVGVLVQDLFRCHDRSRFEIFAYSLSPDDGSEVRRTIASELDHIRDIGQWTDDAIAQRIADDSIDILVDLAGYTKGARTGVFARRPADIQVNYLGYAGSSGGRYIDYAIVDPVICPAGSDSGWTEKLVRLPAVFSPAGGPIPSHPPRDRAELGLPDSSFVFCCFAGNHKIDPSIFSTWMSILKELPATRLWLNESRPETREHLGRAAEARGVDPQRLVFSPHETFGAYMARYGLADLFLDTRWFNAHTTAIDALRCGVPVITLAGETMPARLGATVLRAAGLPELITHSLDEYEARALELARDPATFGALRDKVRRAVPSSALVDTQARARELEAAYAEMVRRHRQGLAPESFTVNAVPQRFNWF